MPRWLLILLLPVTLPILAVGIVVGAVVMGAVVMKETLWPRSLG